MRDPTKEDKQALEFIFPSLEIVPLIDVQMGDAGCREAAIETRRLRLGFSHTGRKFVP